MSVGLKPRLAEELTVHNYTCTSGEVTSQSLWSEYGRRFVGKRGIMCGVWGERFVVL